MRFNVIKSRERNAVAIGWVMRLDRGALSDAERRKLDDWLNKDIRHQGAFARAQAVWSRLRQMGSQSEARAFARRSAGLASARLRLAAAVAVLGLALGWAGYAAFGFFAGREVSDLGEIRRFALNDGSMMVLNTTSAAQIRFDEQARRIVLQHGEASFVVAKHDRRPFIVEAGGISVRAVGTMFTVRMRPAAVAVTVSEGVVEVARPARGALPPERHRVSANLRLTAPESQPSQTQALSHDEVARQNAWQTGLLIFDGDHLRQAADEVNRYSKLKVLIDDPILLDKPFVGVFRTGDSRAFAYAIATLFNARVIEEPADGDLRILVE